MVCVKAWKESLGVLLEQVTVLQTVPQIAAKSLIPGHGSHKASGWDHKLMLVVKWESHG